MTDDLRARLAAVLANTPASFMSAGIESPWGVHTLDEGLPGHDYHGGCALCRGEIETLADAILPVVQAWLNKCRHCQLPAGDAHPMTCPNHVGPVMHGIRTIRQLGADIIQYRCCCGWFWYADEGDMCPNTAETWRGPMPAREGLNDA